MEQEERGGGRRLPLTVFAMHVSAGGGWGGSRGRRGGAVQDSGCLSDCLTGKLHPSYLSENRGIHRSEKKKKPPPTQNGHGGERKRAEENTGNSDVGFVPSARGSEGSAGAGTDAGVSITTTNKPQSEVSREPKVGHILNQDNRAASSPSGSRST